MEQFDEYWTSVCWARCWGYSSRKKFLLVWNFHFSAENKRSQRIWLEPLRKTQEGWISGVWFFDHVFLQSLTDSGGDAKYGCGFGGTGFLMTSARPLYRVVRVDIRLQCIGSSNVDIYTLSCKVLSWEEWWLEEMQSLGNLPPPMYNILNHIFNW